MNPQDNDTNREIIQSFVSEGYERLEDAESRMQYIDTEGHEEIINTVFRLFHSIKGSAGYLNFENIKNVTHEAEALLDLYRREKIKPSQDEVDLLYQTLDFLRQLITSVDRSLSDRGLELESTLVVNSISDSIQNIKKDLETKKAPQSEQAPVKIVRDTADRAKKETKEMLDRLVTPEMRKNFISESLDLLDRSEKVALSLEADPGNLENIQELFRSIHTIKGNSGFFGYNDIESNCMEVENLLDRLRNDRVPPEAATVTWLLKKVDGIRSMVRSLDKNSPERIVELEYKPLGEILIEMGEVTDEMIEEALSEQDRPLGEILIEEGKVSEEAVQKALDMQKKTLEALGKAPGGAVSMDIQRKEIRVDTGKLDKLFDLVGELITAEAMVANSPELQGIELDQFSKSMNSLNKISREIQEITMSIRMIPLEGLFIKMTRLVRDLSRKSDKKVEFLTQGQETEMDKNVMEMISDPLVHIIRNAIDHGIEAPADRLSKGKAEAGKLVLSARYEGSEIWITVKDDGGGLNRDRIIEKAREKGLFSGDPAALTDQEVWQFIFEPGFSTAAKVTEVSGRGVGMDVVKRNIEKIRGKVEVKSDKGAGSEFILRIPLTMAILDGITVRVGKNFYSIPLTDILEFFKVQEDQVTRVEEDAEVINLRGEIIPLVRLYEVFHVPNALEDVREAILIVVQAAGTKACLMIDDITGNQQIVVKSLSDYLGKIDGIMGCSILGDGNVSFIIDSASLLSRVLESA